MLQKSPFWPPVSRYLQEVEHERQQEVGRHGMPGVVILKAGEHEEQPAASSHCHAQETQYPVDLHPAALGPRARVMLASARMNSSPPTTACSMATTPAPFNAATNEVALTTAITQSCRRDTEILSFLSFSLSNSASTHRGELFLPLLFSRPHLHLRLHRRCRRKCRALRG